jgi:hypothetical protein
MKRPSEAVDVYSKAQRVEVRVAPRIAPNLFGRYDAVWVAREPRKDQKLFERERNTLASTGDVVTVVFYAKVAIIVNVRRGIVARAMALLE